MKIGSTGNFTTHHIKAIVYGQSGAGKTSLAATLPHNETIILSAEGGLLSIAAHNIDTIDITKDDSGKLIPRDARANRIKEAFQFLQTEEAKKKYKTVFLDSLSEMGQCVFDACKKDFPDAKQTLPMWGEYGNRMRQLIVAFRDLPDYNVVFTCLSKIDKDDNGKRFAAFDISGSTADKLPGFLDLVLFLAIDASGERKLICQPTDVTPAKDRSGKLEKVEPADLSKIFAKILSKPKQETKGK